MQQVKDRLIAKALEKSLELNQVVKSPIVANCNTFKLVIRY